MHKLNKIVIELLERIPVSDDFDSKKTEKWCIDTTLQLPEIGRSHDALLEALRRFVSDVDRSNNLNRAYVVAVKAIKQAERIMEENENG